MRTRFNPGRTARAVEYNLGWLRDAFVHRAELWYPIATGEIQTEDGPLRDSNDRQVTEAIYTGGVLKPVEAIQLREQERVRVIVEKIEPTERPDRDALLIQLREGIENMDFHSLGPYPSREELHDRR